jgi:uncharacterized RDD family membrane protein YckC
MASDRTSGTSSLLTAGNITSIAIQLYRHHFRDYFQLSVAANGWLLLAVAIVIFSTIAGSMLDPGAIALLVVICIAVMVYGLGRYLSTAAVISRHGFQALLGEPEPLPESKRWLQRRMWGFLGITVLLSLLYGAIAMAAYFILAIAIVAIAVPFIGVDPLGADPQQLVIIGLLVIVLMILVFGVMGYLLIWLSARFTAADMEYTLEEDSGPRRSIGRSWRLSRNHAKRLILVIMMMILATLPIQVLTQLISSLLSLGLGILIPPDNFVYTPLIFLLSYVVGLMFGALILPLWQLSKSVIYYDLCNRREGMLLQLGDRPSTSAQDWLNHATLVTPESVELEFMLAGIGSRSWALSLDYGILGIGLAAFWLIWAWFAEEMLVWLDGSGVNYSVLPYWLLAIALLITFFLFTGYFILFETVWQGQTPGKRIMKLRVIRDNGQPVGLSQAALRSLLRPIDDLLLIGALFVVLGKQEKRIGDWAAGTLVVQESSAEKPAPVTLSKESKTLAAMLADDIAIDRLSPDDFATIRDYLSRRPMLDPKAHRTLRRRLAKTAKERVQLETVPEGVTAEQFLEALYVAYQN